MLIVIYFAVSLIMSDALHVFLSSFQWHDRRQFMLQLVQYVSTVHSYSTSHRAQQSLQL